MTIEELIARLTAASGPDRDLDGAIFEITTGQASRVTRPAFTDSRKTVYQYISGMPAYTASLDAALSLVPEGNFWEVGADENKTMAFAAVMPPEEAWSSCNAPTPALALCIAALRARSRSSSPSPRG